MKYSLFHIFTLECQIGGQARYLFIYHLFIYLLFINLLFIYHSFIIYLFIHLYIHSFI